jgi:hypothetical protein
LQTLYLCSKSERNGKSIGLAIRDMLDDPEVRGRLYTAIAGIEALDDPKYAKKAKRHRRWLEDIDRRRPI